MDAKSLRRYDILFQFASSDFTRRPPLIHQGMEEFLSHDQNEFLAMWEYLLIRYTDLLQTPGFNGALTQDLFQLYYKKSAKNAQKLLFENNVILKACFGASEMPLCPEAMDIVIGLLHGAKYEQTDILFKHAQKNTVLPEGFGGYFKLVFERFTREALEKNKESGKVLSLKKSVCTYLESVIQHITTDEKALLMQRVNELRR
ncbi:MAG: hypothetical protein IJF71_06745 [Clostridia bacterium]|nr:hypothetical protein [Clostridia bacterium]